MLTRLLRPLAGLCLFGVLHATAAVLYVDLNSANPVPPFSSWATAATNIQDAVDAASSGDQVLVTNGIYQTGGRALPGSTLTNRLVITNSITVQSVNGPLVTAIAGYQIPGDITGDSAARCVYMADGAILAGFTITNGSTLTGGNDVEAGGDTSGAGILCPLGDSSAVSNCIFVLNVAGDFGGGIYGGTLYNCLVVSNSALLGSYGGGTFGGNYYNCTITANIAAIGAGDSFGNLVNCIVYGNDPGGGNYGFSTLNYCCTTPDPGTTGNVISDPLFANPSVGNYRLLPGSPCVNAGNNAFVTSPTDLAGNPRISDGTVDMGAYELQFHYVDQNGTNPISPFSSWTTAATNIQDAVDAAANYDEVLVTNGLFQTGGRPAFGLALTNRLIVTNAITVQSVNGPAATIIKGSQAPATNGPGAVRCAYLAGGAQLVGFTLTNGATLNSASASHDQFGGGVLCADIDESLSRCVINGNYAYSGGGGAFMGTLDDCTFTSNAVVPLVVLIGGVEPEQNGAGGGAVGSTLNRCVLTGNSAAQGGGVFSGTLNNCFLVGNTAITPSFMGSPHGAGGGATQAVLNSCILVDNYSFIGGGAYAGYLYNCTVVSNSAFASGGGSYYGFAGFLYNCIVYSNSAPTASNYSGSTLSFCCTTPLPTAGIGNITNDPLFVNPATGDYHLQSNSPCINAGNNAYAPVGPDLDGNPRISGGTVDIGAYEFQNPASIISYAWLQQYGLPTDGSADFLDPDHDGLNNWQEWLAGTDPTNASSVLQMLAPTPSGTNLIVTWQSVPNITYSLQRATDLTADPAFQTIATNIPGNAGTTSYTDTNAPPPGPYYYRVGVQ